MENMILGIGEYRDYETYLPKCKEITEQLGDMIRDILNASRLQTQGNNEPCSNFSLRTLLTELCEPYRLIAEAKGVKFKTELLSDILVHLPEGQLKKQYRISFQMRSTIRRLDNQYQLYLIK